MNEPRRTTIAAVLNDGKVLIAGWSEDTSTELYDPASNTFAPPSATPQMNEPRINGATIAVLDSGKVLIAGPDTSTELYDPVSNSFAPPSQTASMNVVRNSALAIALNNGKVLIAGGSGGGNFPPIPIGGSELYDEASNTFAPPADTARWAR
ncbi:MAG: hypothetical protein ACLQDV_25665 [Candidatus Binataceae bacterium]